MKTQNTLTTLALKTNVKAGAFTTNHNQAQLAVRTGVKAGGIIINQ